MALVDKEGKRRVLLATATPDGFPGLSLHDRDGKPRAMLVLTASGSPGLLLYDSDAKRRVSLVTAGGSPSLRLADKTGLNRAVLGVTETVNKRAGAEIKTAENTLTLFDAEGNMIWQAPR